MPSNDLPTSQDSLTNADRTVNEFSGRDGALGQAGVHDTAPMLPIPEDRLLGRAGDSIVLSPTAVGFPDMYVGCSWNLGKTPMPGLLGSIGFKRTRKIDLDLGCLYNLTDGTRGGLQALGADNGSMVAPPYIWLSHDERTGARDGDDEFLKINGQKWPEFQRVLIYAYIYAGAADWAGVAPDVTIRIPGQAPVHVTPMIQRTGLGVCAIALMEQIRGGIKITNLTEYFPGQAEMDRAYGFGVQWTDGVK